MTVTASGFSDRMSAITKEPLVMLGLLDGIEQLPHLPLADALQPCGLVSSAKYAWGARQFVTLHLKTVPFGLTDNEAAAVNIYTQQWTKGGDSLYYRLNAALREADRSVIRPYFSYMALLLSALNKLPKFEKPIVYRGVKGNLSADYPNGKEGVWWAFSSCTKSLQALESPLFCGPDGDRTVFAIRCNNGVSITEFSSFKNEDEVLLPAGFYFVVEGAANLGHGLRMIQLAEKPAEFKLVE
eukprot:TRINITY_DN5452_c0_g1_i1.p1 TRINITY_DN5452_c0_g1~~TRINITY_DN5452_c0_g1_i1.p1  ORF type:complete len:276 (-),score=55.76 TRINITY_DN5452_c0_g1_i1:207-929(-)